MGDRIGIVFKDINGGESMVLQHHWAGRRLLKEAQQWLHAVPDPSKYTAGCALAHFLQWYGGEFGIDDEFVIQDNYDDTEDNGIFVVDLGEKVVA